MSDSAKGTMRNGWRTFIAFQLPRQAGALTQYTRLMGVSSGMSATMRRRVVRTIMCTVAVLAVVSVRSTSPGAQWLHYPTTGVPRTPEGTPNLDAPTPRTADGKPDFSG